MCESAPTMYISNFKIQNPKFDNTAMQNSHVRYISETWSLELLMETR